MYRAARDNVDVYNADSGHASNWGMQNFQSQHVKISYLLQIDKNKLLLRDIVIYDCIYHRTSYTGVAVTDRPSLCVSRPRRCPELFVVCQTGSRSCDQLCRMTDEL